MKSFLYPGTIEHRRFSPVSHEFRYRVCYYFLDLDEVKSLFRVPFFFSYNFPGLLAFHRKNYMGPVDLPLKDAVKMAIKKHTDEDFEGSIRILTNISWFGFCFNPVSFYYCYDASEKLKYIVSEVTNTPWGERNTEVYPFRGEKQTLQQHPKTFHVSPFMQMGIDYSFVLNRPEEKIHILMQNRKTGEKDVIFDSTLALKRVPMTGLNVFWHTLKYPAMTFTTVFGIYWQALLLYFIKKTPFYDHPERKT